MSLSEPFGGKHVHPCGQPSIKKEFGNDNDHIDPQHLKILLE